MMPPPGRTAMHPRTFPMAYPAARHHEQLPCIFHLVYPTIYHPASTTQTLVRLHDEVKNLRREEQGLQQQIHQYRTALDKVQRDLYAKINKANELQNFLAPISRLPNEMLLAIFEEAVACRDPGAEQRVECTIARVSRRWRDVAIHSPRLWRRVCITPRVTPTMLEMYKARGSRALDIEICGWKDRRDFQRFDTALDTMLDSTSRWRSLTITCVCDTHLSHLILKLTHVGQFSGLKYFTFRALRPGQTCSVNFLTENTATTQSPCSLKSLDVENFMLTGDMGNIRARALQSFSKLSSLTLRRYSNDTRSLRIMIDFSAFRAMLSAIPILTTLVLLGQPLRFRTDPAGQASQDDGSGHGAGSGDATITLPHLHTLVLHPGVLKPRYLQHTISAIHAPALRHFELIFPDSKISGQSIVEQLFVDASPLPSSSSYSSSSYSSSPSYSSSLTPYHLSSHAPYVSSAAATQVHVNGRRPRFPRVETVVLHNVSNAGTALAFVHAFPCTTQATLGGVDVGFFPLVLRTGTGTYFAIVTTGSRAKTGMSAVEPGSRALSGLGLGSGPGLAVGPPYDGTSGTGARYACWRQLRTLTLRQPRPETHHVLVDWLRSEEQRGHVAPTLVIEGSLDRLDVQALAARARMHTRVELVGLSAAVPVPIQ